MVLNAAWKGFSPLRSTLAVILQRNFGLTAVALNKIKELDPIQKLFMDKIQEYSRKSKSAGGPVDGGQEYSRVFSEEMQKLQRLYGGGNLEKFPDFRFQEPVFEYKHK
uniref:ATP synthase-coupling factor 6, mitochondrial-like n=1 Tax=Myxine glutinosa TaxID=7769 RepID=UPI00358E8628